MNDLLPTVNGTWVARAVFRSLETSSRRGERKGEGNDSCSEKVVNLNLCVCEVEQHLCQTETWESFLLGLYITLYTHRLDVNGTGLCSPWNEERSGTNIRHYSRVEPAGNNDSHQINQHDVGAQREYFVDSCQLYAFM